MKRNDNNSFGGHPTGANEVYEDECVIALCVKILESVRPLEELLRRRNNVFALYAVKQVLKVIESLRDRVAEGIKTFRGDVEKYRADIHKRGKALESKMS